MSTDAMRAALDEAARSLETIAMKCGKDEFLSDLRDVAAYAGNRARIARAALAQLSVSAERVPLTDEAAPVATDARGMLEFLSARFKHAGVSEAVAESYARDIDAILAAEAKPARVPLTDEQRDALRIVLHRCGHDRRVLCLHDLLRDPAHGITAKVAP